MIPNPFARTSDSNIALAFTNVDPESCTKALYWNGPLNFTIAARLLGIQMVLHSAKDLGMMVNHLCAIIGEVSLRMLG